MAIACQSDPMRALREDPLFAYTIDQLRVGPVEGFAMSNDKLFKVTKKGQLRLAVPPLLRRRLFDHHHSGTLGAHSSASKLVRQLSTSYD